MPNHVCGVRTGFSNILSADGSTLVPGTGATSTSRLLLHHHRDNMDRASQVLAQGVHSGVPKSYLALADYGINS